MSKVKLFISHASEDKDEFVRPLAEALLQSFDVWYDEYSLLVGPGLLAQISKGMKECQYGVVVLSKSFFGKKWTRGELDGLFDLEPADQSLILPIWHGVTHEEVSDYSPILAGRAATRSDLGIPRVVSDLKRSIEAGERTKVISDPLSDKIRAFQEAADSEEKFQSWAWSAVGIEAVWREWTSIGVLARDILERYQENRFQVGGPYEPVAGRSWFILQGPFFPFQESGNNQSKRKLVLRFDLWDMAINSVFTAQGRYRVLLQRAVRTTDPADFTNEFWFKPYCNRTGEPLWRDQRKSTFSTKELVELALIELFDTANKLQNGEPLTHVPEID